MKRTGKFVLIIAIGLITNGCDSTPRHTKDRLLAPTEKIGDTYNSATRDAENNLLKRANDGLDDYYRRLEEQNKQDQNQ